MFNRKDKQTINNGIYTLISTGTTMNGDIETTEDIRLDGTFYGNITSNGRIIIGQSGRIQGNINCESVEISGRLEGDVIATDLFSMKDKSHYKGSVDACNLNIERGAQFFGTCKMVGRDGIDNLKKELTTNNITE